MPAIGKENVTRMKPCLICGKPDWCLRVDFGQDGIYHYCGRTDGNANPTVTGMNGETFLYQRHDAKNGYYVFLEQTQAQINKDRFLAKKRLENPELFHEKTWHTIVGSLAHAQSSAGQHKQIVKEEQVAVAPPEQLNKVYSTLLSYLTLEDAHIRTLQKEWTKGVEPNLFNILIQRWPIRSLPVPDETRDKMGCQLRSYRRRQIMDALYQQFGSEGLKGVPGFYEPKDGVWEMASISGIVYPCYDSHGNIVRLRINDEHPSVERYKTDANGNKVIDANGKAITDGVFRWNKSGYWTFTSFEAGSKPVRTTPILSDKGYPVGKVSGKYKNFTSYAEKQEEKDGVIHVRNAYRHGCSSGSHCGFYCKEGDDTNTCYIIEGEKKALVVNQLFGVPTVAIPGVSTWGKLFMPEEGYEQSLMERLVSVFHTVNFIICYDADKNENAAVLKAEGAAVRAFMERGCQIYLAEWNPQFGKGIDDIAIDGNRPAILKVT